MSHAMMIFLLACSVVILIGIVLYQQYMFHRGIGATLEKISEELKDILDTESDRKVMVFTDQEALMKLSGQINRLILEREKIKVNFKRQEMSSKKMLANISHDMKTPLTVILGYLEMMRRDNPQGEALRKVEAKAEQVVEFGISEKDIYAWGDGQAIGRILDNLLSNAIRYGGDGKYLGVFLREETDMVCVDVTDRGKGIEKKFATKLLLYTCIYLGAQRMSSSFVIDVPMEHMSFYVQLLAKSAVTVSMGFIVLFVGLAMRSSRATIVASFVLIFLTQANVGDYTLAGKAVFPMILPVVSLVFAGLSIYRVERRDV